MSDVKEDGFKTSEVLSTLAGVFEKMSDKEKKEQIKKTNGVFQLNVKTKEGKEGTWVIDLKNEGKVSKGPAKKAGKFPFATIKTNQIDVDAVDVTMNLTDDTFIQLADGKLNGQKAFMTGALKVKGNIMLATKLDGVLKSAKAKL